MNGAEISNALFVVTILAYAAAMFAYALEYAFAQRSAEQRILVAPGGEPVDDHSRPTDRAPLTSSAAQGAGRLGLILTYVGTAALTVSIVTRIVYTGRWPWGNMFEYITGVALVGMITWLVLVARGAAPRRLGLFATFAATMVLGGSVRVYTEAAALVPALDSYWIVIHVTAAIIAAGILLIGCVFALLHLLKRAHDRRAARGRSVEFFPLSVAHRLPQADALERLTFKLHVFAFPILTFGIFAGAVWAHFAWGRYWAWDPKEVWAFIAWVVYAAYLHARVSGRAARAWAPWIAVLGYAVMIFNLTAVNLVFDGLHSYSGV
ncbi:c-type cytochrome biogenesis protein CcsB [Glycomyces tenuis]|uniref:c-type cytochrome biogenesis protein CcsB n=1 Tax=Glycomyces tenuis TaxID=58116 RepID=UPI0003F62786|nr:c-type cytochrome biogenesis protein CcsB [Glycomyces tenuis]